jgi:hypothetical protein
LSPRKKGDIFSESDDHFGDSEEEDGPSNPVGKSPTAAVEEAVEASVVEAADLMVVVPPAPAHGILKSPTVFVAKAVPLTAKAKIAKWVNVNPKAKESAAKQINMVKAAKASSTAAGATTEDSLASSTTLQSPTEAAATAAAAARLAKVTNIALGRTLKPRAKQVARKTLGIFVSAPPAQQMAIAARPAKKQKTAKKAVVAPKTPGSTGKKKGNNLLIFEGFPTKHFADGWPAGWIERRYERQTGTRAQDSYFFPPGDTAFKFKLRSIPEVKRFQAAFAETQDMALAFQRRKG